MCFLLNMWLHLCASVFHRKLQVLLIHCLCFIFIPSWDETKRWEKLCFSPHCSKYLCVGHGAAPRRGSDYDRGQGGHTQWGSESPSQPGQVSVGHEMQFSYVVVNISITFSVGTGNPSWMLLCFIKVVRSCNVEGKRMRSEVCFFTLVSINTSSATVVLRNPFLSLIVHYTHRDGHFILFSLNNSCFPSMTGPRLAPAVSVSNQPLLHLNTINTQVIHFQGSNYRGTKGRWAPVKAHN